MSPLSHARAARAVANASAAEALRRAAFSIAGRLGFVTVVMAAVFSPALLAGVVLLVLPQPRALGSDLTWVSLGALVVIALNALLGAPAIGAVLTQHTILGLGGDRAPFGVAVRHALAAALRTLPLALSVAVIEACGYTLLIVPGIVASILLALAIPIQVVERTSVGAALARSVKLTAGARWALFIVLGTAGTVAAIAAQLTTIFLGPFGFVLGFALQAALVGAAAAVVYSDRRLAHEGVDIDALVRQLGGTPGGAARALDAEVERALAEMSVASSSTPPTAISEAPRSVGDDALLEGARGRDRRMKIVRNVALAAVVVGGLTALALGAQSRLQAKRDSEAASAKMLSDLATARGTDFVVRQAIVSRPDLYGKKLGALGVALSDSNEKFRAMQVLGILEDELTAMGCQDAIAPAKRSGRAADFARGCPAAPLVESDARGLGAAELAVATALEARAAKVDKSDDPTHKAIMKALLDRSAAGRRF